MNKEKRIDKFLKLMRDRGASDLHFVTGKPPIFRVVGDLEPLLYTTITERQFLEWISEITPSHIWKTFLEKGDYDFSYELEGVARFRVNLYKHEFGYGAVFRIIPTNILSFEQLGLPKAVEKFTTYEKGLILVTGPTGSGKSTTLAAIINKLNVEKKFHIITIEDPIEFSHENINSIITQREIGQSAVSFYDALRVSVREDPDCILVGEMRDLETIHMALLAAEAGFLIYATMHTNSASRTVDRMINVFPTEEQDVVRSILGATLRGILSQQLLPKKVGGRTPAVEILFSSPAVANLIRENKPHLIENIITTGKKEGMISMDEFLFNLVKQDIVDARIAYEKSINKETFRKRLFDEFGIKVLKEEEEIGL